MLGDANVSIEQEVYLGSSDAEHIMFVEVVELVEITHANSLSKVQEKPIDVPLLLRNDWGHAVDILTRWTGRELRIHPL